jgi:hypothetical protein
LVHPAVGGELLSFLGGDLFVGFRAEGVAFDFLGIDAGFGSATGDEGNEEEKGNEEEARSPPRAAA